MQTLEIPHCYKLTMDIIKTLIEDKSIPSNIGLPLHHYFRIVRSPEFYRAIPYVGGCLSQYCSQRTHDENICLALHLGNILSQSLMEPDVMRRGLMIHRVKKNQLMLEGMPLNSKLIMESFWSIDRTISEKILKYWLDKFHNLLEIRPPRVDSPDRKSEGQRKDDYTGYLLKSHEYLYLLANTTCKSEFVDSS
jgi:hypothetical protein